jgi:hypothetical protein
VPLDLAGGQHRTAGRRDGRRREPVGCGDGHDSGVFGLWRFSRRRVIFCEVGFIWTSLTRATYNHPKH